MGGRVQRGAELCGKTWDVDEDEPVPARSC